MVAAILRQELIVIYHADAALLAADNSHSTIGKTIHAAEYFADGQQLYLTVRFLLPNSDARKEQDL